MVEVHIEPDTKQDVAVDGGGGARSAMERPPPVDSVNPVTCAPCASSTVKATTFP